MKMSMSCRAKESGLLHWGKRPGAILETASTIATMTLDDASQCLRALPYDGAGWTEEKDKPARPCSLYQEFCNVRTGLENALAGYSHPDLHFEPEVRRLVSDFLRLLLDARLPLYDMRGVMASISGRLPADLERLIARALTSYEHNITSVIAQFPAQRILAEVDRQNARLDAADKDTFDMTVAPVVEVCVKYRHGVRGMLKAQANHLLAKYLEVEQHFQVGQYDKVVNQMQRSAGPRADMTEIVDRIFAHKQYRKRNYVVTCLLDVLFHEEPRLMAELKPILIELTNLVKQENSSVCLKARTILIACEKPTFDIRYNFMEKMFLDGTNKSEDSTSSLQAMITDESAIFDVLGEFFYHLEEGVRQVQIKCLLFNNEVSIGRDWSQQSTFSIFSQAALEVYIRRAFISYDITCLQHQRLPLGQSCVYFQLLLPQSHPNRSYQQVSQALILHLFFFLICISTCSEQKFNTIDRCGPEPTSTLCSAETRRTTAPGLVPSALSTHSTSSSQTMRQSSSSLIAPSSGPRTRGKESIQLCKSNHCIPYQNLRKPIKKSDLRAPGSGSGRGRGTTLTVGWREARAGSQPTSCMWPSRSRTPRATRSFRPS
jgi:acetyl-CoA carboxylase/biotin carboxylase 1